MNFFESFLAEYQYCTVNAFFGANLKDVLASNTGKNAISQMFIHCMKNENLNPFELLLKYGFIQKINDEIPEDLEIPVLKRQ